MKALMVFALLVCFGIACTGCNKPIREARTVPLFVP